MSRNQHTLFPIEELNIESEIASVNDVRATLLHGNCIEVLRTLPEKSVHCCVTSPPYYGLRDYGNDQDVWGGDEGCKHVWLEETKKSNRWGGIETMSAKQTTNYGSFETAIDNALSQGQFCQNCGAWRGALGLEPTPDCGRPFMELRLDLTEREKEFVLKELKREGLL